MGHYRKDRNIQFVALMLKPIIISVEARILCDESLSILLKLKENEKNSEWKADVLHLFWKFQFLYHSPALFVSLEGI